jgi:hypothetical protein
MWMAHDQVTNTHEYQQVDHLIHSQRSRTAASPGVTSPLLTVTGWAVAAWLGTSITGGVEFGLLLPTSRSQEIVVLVLLAASAGGAISEWRRAAVAQLLTFAAIIGQRFRSTRPPAPRCPARGCHDGDAASAPCWTARCPQDSLTFASSLLHAVVRDAIPEPVCVGVDRRRVALTGRSRTSKRWVPILFAVICLGVFVTAGLA